LYSRLPPEPCGSARDSMYAASTAADEELSVCVPCATTIAGQCCEEHRLSCSTLKCLLYWRTGPFSAQAFAAGRANASSW
jgi:hypothetical protein